MYSYNAYKKSGIELQGLDNSFFTQALVRVSNYGKPYQDEVLRNARGLHKNEDPKNNMLPPLVKKFLANATESTTIAALDPNYMIKKDVLKAYAQKDTIRSYVSKMATEIIIYNQRQFCRLLDLPNDYDEVIRKRIAEIFQTVYNGLRFNEGTKAWDVAFDFLVEGYVCYNIVWDSKKKKITGFQRFDPSTLTLTVDENSGTKMWVQNLGDSNNMAYFLDSEIVYLSYAGASNYMETSYVEPLIRPYNELKQLERAKLMFNLINAVMHKKIVIPTNGLSPILAEMEVFRVLSEVKEKVEFDDSTGMITINGAKNLPFSQETVFTTNAESGTPEYEIIDPQGADLNENVTLKWFKSNLQEASKFPITRFTEGGGVTYKFGDDISHDELNLHKYVERIRAGYKEILIKPVILQLLMEFPELAKNPNFINDVDIEYLDDADVTKARTLSNLQKKSEIVGALRGIVDSDSKPIIHIKMLLKEIMEFDDAWLEENDRLKREEPEGDRTGGEEGSLPPASSSSSSSPSSSETSPSEEAPTETTPTEATPPTEGTTEESGSTAPATSEEL